MFWHHCDCIQRRCPGAIFEHHSISEAGWRSKSSQRVKRVESCHEADEIFSMGGADDSCWNSHLGVQDNPRNVPLFASISLSVDLDIFRRPDEFSAAFSGNASASFEALLDDAEPFRQ